MPDNDLIEALEAVVYELKRGINQFNEKLKLNPDNAKIMDYIKRMHNSALKINVGIDGLREVEELKKELTDSRL